MSFLAWIVLGLLAGFIGSKIVNKQGEGLFLDILLGIVGAIAGGCAAVSQLGFWVLLPLWVRRQAPSPAS